jgi:hypothetical protein
VAWNRAARSGKTLAEASALEWALTAMRDSTERLPRVAELDCPRAIAVISEAVWWVTIVDGTLVRYHPEAYDRELRSRSPADQALIEETLAGLRLVRNQMGQDVDHIDFIRPKKRCWRQAARPCPRLDLEPDAGTLLYLAVPARAGVGAGQVPGLPVPARRSPRGTNLPAGNGVPDRRFGGGNAVC